MLCLLCFTYHAPSENVYYLVKFHNRWDQLNLSAWRCVWFSTKWWNHKRPCQPDVLSGSPPLRKISRGWFEGCGSFFFGSLNDFTSAAIEKIRCCYWFTFEDGQFKRLTVEGFSSNALSWLHILFNASEKWWEWWIKKSNELTIQCWPQIMLNAT